MGEMLPFSTRGSEGGGEKLTNSFTLSPDLTHDRGRYEITLRKSTVTVSHEGAVNKICSFHLNYNQLCILYIVLATVLTSEELSRTTSGCVTET